MSAETTTMLLTADGSAAHHPGAQAPDAPHPARRPASPPAPGTLPRLLPAGPPAADLAGHQARFGALPYRGRPGLLIPAIEASGLTGRGGAAFPVHRKMTAVLGARRPPVVVGNGAEGEPVSGKDRCLLWQSPHLVLDGLQLAAEALGATAAALYVHRDDRLMARLSAVLAQRSAAGLDRVAVELAGAPGRFLAGEESALASAAAGGPARPAYKRPPVYLRGIGGRPTLVQNVETLAHVALIARFGPGWFRSVGTADEPGSMLCTVLRPDGGSTVVEAALGTPLAALADCGAGVQAVLCGGYHGAWLTAADAAWLRLCNADLRPAGAFAGAGILGALPADRCGLAETARVARYLALESAGQCGPCLSGLPRIAAALTGLAGPSPDPGTLADVRRWAGLVQGRGACRHPDGTVRFVRSALTVFGPEIAAHARGTCTATSGQPFLPLPAPPRGEQDWR
ncbi:MAG: NADH-ubiquinone oxidoreductase-F iron-sulfur binding region domain-containing protein [Streptosporangiaceae bacterium]